MSIIKALKMGHDYLKYTGDNTEPEKVCALDDLNMEIREGEFVAILGHNGSGKSTLAKHFNALLLPSRGTVWVGDMDTAKEPELWKIRQKAGMVFQNPDNQIIATVVEEDVGFGPENLSVPTEDIWTRVDDALKKVGMTAFRAKSPNHLSGGQKQRVAIAGVVAMKPSCIIMDEPTAMLDPNGRKEVLKVVHELNRQEHVTVILITHYMEEVVDADRVYVMDKGRLVMQGTPREIFSKVDVLKDYGLSVPAVTDLADALRHGGMDLSSGILTAEELLKAIGPGPGGTETVEETPCRKCAGDKKCLLEMEDVSFVYGENTVYRVDALNHINLKIYEGEFTALIGHTGSGKSTLIQHLNGLEKPTSGRVLWEGRDIFEDGFNRRSLRSKVGLVFQYPEHQLFETTILADVMFGPLNQGLTKAEAEEKARNALTLTGIGEGMYDESPFEISGGQKRRVAIAGVLAMEPRVLILDEPTAGLDPAGRDEILNCIKELQHKKDISIVLVTHSMEDAARYADRLVVLYQSEVQFDGSPKEVFRHYLELEKIGLAAPALTYVMHDLAKEGWMVDTDAMTVEEAAKNILEVVKHG